MTDIQGGADFPSAKKTKGELKKQLAESPELVGLYCTSNMGPQFSGMANELPEDAQFLVVGPDPFTKRNWYATVTRKGDKITCK